MKIKITVVLMSIFVALMLISSGYGVWNKSLKIEGNIRVVPEPKVLEEMETWLDDLEKRLDEEFMSEQNLAVEQLQLQMKKSAGSAQNNDNNGELRLEQNINKGVEEETKDTAKNENRDIEPEEDINKETEGVIDSVAGNNNNDIGLKSGENINKETEKDVDNISGSDNNEDGLNEDGYESDNNGDELNEGCYESGN